MRVLLMLVSVLLLTACGDDEPPPPKQVKASPHGSVLLFDDAMRNFSNINTCMFQAAAAKWATTEYPGATVQESSWSSSALYNIKLETEEFVMTIYFNGAIVDTVKDDC